MRRSIKIGTRGSELALWQARWVASALRQGAADLDTRLVTIKTTGDQIQDVPLAKVGGKGLFVKEIEMALLSGAIDMAVHSMKDMPSDLPPGLSIGAVTERENPADVLIARGHLAFRQLPAGASVGTSSLRRGAQIKSRRPDLNIVPLRGNLTTRLKKLDSEALDAIVLAAAGVKRLGLEAHISEYLDHDTVLPAVGQGALCIEIRSDDKTARELAATLDHAATHTAVTAERAFLRRMEGGCQVPIAAHASVTGATLSLSVLVADLNGVTVLRDTLDGPSGSPEELGLQAAERLLKRGAAELLEELTAGQND